MEKISLALEILSLLLVIPLTILGNVLTPIVGNWWAERSDSKTQKRIDDLTDELNDPELFIRADAFLWMCNLLA